ncbi:MAG: ArsC/Spx/MgsR family protein [Pseudomonadota bacterium]
MTVHGIKTCDTCRKALKALAAADHAAELRDFRADPISADKIAKWWAQFGAALLNTRSTTWRALTEAERAKEPQTLLLEHPTLVKRPVIEGPDGQVHLGWTQETRAAFGL